VFYRRIADNHPSAFELRMDRNGFAYKPGASSSPNTLGTTEVTINPNSVLKVDTAAVHVNAVKSVVGEKIILSGSHPGQRVVSDGVVNDRTKLEVGMRIYINGVDTGAKINSIVNNTEITTDVALGAVASPGSGIAFHERYEPSPRLHQVTSTNTSTNLPIKASDCVSTTGTTKTLTLDSLGPLARDSNLLGYTIGLYNFSVGSPISSSITETNMIVIGQQLNANNKIELTLKVPNNLSPSISDQDLKSRDLVFYIPSSWNLTTNTLNLGNQGIGGVASSVQKILNGGFDDSRTSIASWNSVNADLMKETITKDSSNNPISVITMEDDGLTYSTTTLRPDSVIKVIDPPIASGTYASRDTESNTFEISISATDAQNIEPGSRIYKNGVDTGLAVAAISTGSSSGKFNVTYSAGLSKWVDNFFAGASSSTNVSFYPRYIGELLAESTDSDADTKNLVLKQDPGVNLVGYRVLEFSGNEVDSANNLSPFFRDTGATVTATTDSGLGLTLDTDPNFAVLDPAADRRLVFVRELNMMIEDPVTSSAINSILAPPAGTSTSTIDLADPVTTEVVGKSVFINGIDTGATVTAGTTTQITTSIPITVPIGGAGISSGSVAGITFRSNSDPRVSGTLFFTGIHNNPQNFEGEPIGTVKDVAYLKRGYLSTGTNGPLTRTDAPPELAALTDAPSGTQFVDLNGAASGIGVGGYVSQTISTTPGQRYRLTFFQGANDEDLSNPPTDPNKEIKVFIGGLESGQLINGAEMGSAYNINTTGMTTPWGWRQRTIDFLATNNATEIKFQSFDNSGPFGPAVDSVSVTQIAGTSAPTWGRDVTGYRVFVREDNKWVDTGRKVISGSSATEVQLDGAYLKADGTNGLIGYKDIEFRPELSMTLETPNGATLAVRGTSNNNDALTGGASLKLLGNKSSVEVYAAVDGVHVGKDVTSGVTTNRTITAQTNSVQGYKPVSRIDFVDGRNIDSLIPDPGSANPSFFTDTTISGQWKLPGGATENYSIKLDLSDTALEAMEFAVNKSGQDGEAATRLTSVNIDNRGRISGVYGSGKVRYAGQVALTHFDAFELLSPFGENVFAATEASGTEEGGFTHDECGNTVDANGNPIPIRRDPTNPATGIALFNTYGVFRGKPGTANLGEIRSGALESSTVDLSNELVKLMILQRTYSSNSQSLRAQDQTLQTLLQSLG